MARRRSGRAHRVPPRTPRRPRRAHPPPRPARPSPAHPPPKPSRPKRHKPPAPPKPKRNEAARQRILAEKARRKAAADRAALQQHLLTATQRVTGQTQEAIEREKALKQQREQASNIHAARVLEMLWKEHGRIPTSAELFTAIRGRTPQEAAQKLARDKGAPPRSPQERFLPESASQEIERFNKDIKSGMLPALGRIAEAENRSTPSPYANLEDLKRDIIMVTPPHMRASMALDMRMLPNNEKAFQEAAKLLKEARERDQDKLDKAEDLLVRLASGRPKGTKPTRAEEILEEQLRERLGGPPKPEPSLLTRIAMSGTHLPRRIVGFATQLSNGATVEQAWRLGKQFDYGDWLKDNPESALNIPARAVYALVTTAAQEPDPRSRYDPSFDRQEYNQRFMENFRSLAAYDYANKHADKTEFGLEMVLDLWNAVPAGFISKPLKAAGKKVVKGLDIATNIPIVRGIKQGYKADIKDLAKIARAKLDKRTNALVYRRIREQNINRYAHLNPKQIEILQAILRSGHPLPKKPTGRITQPIIKAAKEFRKHMDELYQREAELARVLGGDKPAFRKNYVPQYSKEQIGKAQAGETVVGAGQRPWELPQRVNMSFRNAEEFIDSVTTREYAPIRWAREATDEEIAKLYGRPQTPAAQQADVVERARSTMGRIRVTPAAPRTLRAVLQQKSNRISQAAKEFAGLKPQERRMLLSGYARQAPEIRQTTPPERAWDLVSAIPGRTYSFIKKFQLALNPAWYAKNIFDSVIVKNKLAGVPTDDIVDAFKGLARGKTFVGKDKFGNPLHFEGVYAQELLNLKNGFLQQMGNLGEDTARNLLGNHMYWRHLNRVGHSRAIELAMDKIRKVHFNYDELTDLDRVMKHIDLYWVFHSRNAKYWASQAINRPWIPVNIEKAQALAEERDLTRKNGIRIGNIVVNPKDWLSFKNYTSRITPSSFVQLPKSDLDKGLKLAQQAGFTLSPIVELATARAGYISDPTWKRYLPLFQLIATVTEADIEGKFLDTLGFTPFEQRDERRRYLERKEVARQITRGQKPDIKRAKQDIHRRNVLFGTIGYLAGFWLKEYTDQDEMYRRAQAAFVKAAGNKDATRRVYDKYPWLKAWHAINDVGDESPEDFVARLKEDQRVQRSFKKMEDLIARNQHVVDAAIHKAESNYPKYFRLPAAAKAMARRQWDIFLKSHPEVRQRIEPLTSTKMKRMTTEDIFTVAHGLMQVKAAETLFARERPKDPKKRQEYYRWRESYIARWDLERFWGKDDSMMERQWRKRGKMFGQAMKEIAETIAGDPMAGIKFYRELNKRPHVLAMYLALNPEKRASYKRVMAFKPFGKHKFRRGWRLFRFQMNPQKDYAMWIESLRNTSFWKPGWEKLYNRFQLWQPYFALMDAGKATHARVYLHKVRRLLDIGDPKDPNTRRLVNLNHKYMDLPRSERRAFLKEHPELIEFWRKNDTPEEKALHPLMDEYFGLENPSDKRVYLRTHPALKDWFDQRNRDREEAVAWSYPGFREPYELFRSLYKDAQTFVRTRGGPKAVSRK